MTESNGRAKFMQGTADFHHHVAYAVFPHPDRLFFQHTTAFDTAMHMFDTHPASRELPVDRFLCGGQCFSTRLLRRLEALHACQRAPLQAEVLPPRLPAGNGYGVIAARRLSCTLPGAVALRHTMRTAVLISRRFFSLWRFFLAALTRFLCNRICGVWMGLCRHDKQGGRGGRSGLDDG